MIKPSDIHTLTDFKRNSTELLRKLEDSGRPQVLTVDGRPRMVLLDVGTFERLAALEERAAAIEGIRRGLADVEAGRTLSLEEFKARMEETLGTLSDG